MNGLPSPVSFNMTLVLSMSRAPDAVIVVLMSLSLRPSAFGRWL